MNRFLSNAPAVLATDVFRGVNSLFMGVIHKVGVKIWMVLGWAMGLDPLIWPGLAIHLLPTTSFIPDQTRGLTVEGDMPEGELENSSTIGNHYSGNLSCN